MKTSQFKRVLCNGLLFAEGVVLFFLLCAAIQGSLPLLNALVAAAGSFLGCNILTSLILVRRHGARKSTQTVSRPSVVLSLHEQAGQRSIA